MESISNVLAIRHFWYSVCSAFCVALAGCTFAVATATESGLAIPDASPALQLDATPITQLTLIDEAAVVVAATPTAEILVSGGLAAVIPDATPIQSLNVPTEEIPLAEVPQLNMNTAQDVTVLAHYMAWYKTREYSGEWLYWDWGDHNPDNLRLDGFPDAATAHRPLIGLYDSRDPAVLDYQLATAWATGIRGFVIDWYGPNDRGNIDGATQAMFAAVERMSNNYGIDFKVGLMYEEKTLGHLEDENKPIVAKQHIQYILDTYSERPHYLRHDDVPVIFYWQALSHDIPALLSPAQLGTLQSELPEFKLLYLGANSDYLAVTDGFYSWVSGANEDPLDYGEDYLNWVYPEMEFQSSQHELSLTVGSVYPGFDDSATNGWGGGSRFIDRQDGLVYEVAWQRAVEANQKGSIANLIQVVTWNDWPEGTEIEPSIEYGRSYLETTQTHISTLTGETYSADALVIPELILTARRNYPSAETEAIVHETHQLFFQNRYPEAQALISAYLAAQ